MAELIQEIAKGVHEYGPVTMLLTAGLLVNGFFIWRDYRREDRQQRQIDELNRMQREIMVPLLTECKAVISQNSQIIMSFLRGRD